MLSLTSPLFSMLPDFDLSPPALGRHRPAVWRVFVDHGDNDETDRDRPAAARQLRPPAPVRARPNFRVHSAEAESTIAVELPGVPKANVDVQVHGRVLTVSGKRYAALDRRAADTPPANTGTAAEPASEPSQDAARDPRTEPDTARPPLPHQPEQGPQQQHSNQQPPAHSPPAPAVTFDLSLKLAPDVDADAVSVQSYADGVLVLTVPHLRPAAARRLTVQ